MEKTNKLCPNFDPTPYTVEKRNEGDVMVRNDKTGQSYRRNILHLKRVKGIWKPANNRSVEELENSDK